MFAAGQHTAVYHMHLAHLALIIACLPACDKKCLAAFWLPKIVTLTCLLWQNRQNQKTALAKPAELG